MAEHEIADFEIPMRNRRAWVRLPSDQDVSCRLMAGTDKTRWTGKVRDISQGGVALVLRQKLQPGTGLLIDLTTNAGEMLSLPARVVCITLARDGCWITGCAFAKTLSKEELGAFLPV